MAVAVGATAAGASARQRFGQPYGWVRFLAGAAGGTPAVLAPAGFGRLLQPLTVFHPEWVGERIEKLTGALAKFRNSPGALLACFTGAVFVQGTMVFFYFAVAYALHLDVTLTDLAVIVPISFVVQMLPVSVSWFGVREATFSFYFTPIRHPIASAVLMSLVGQALIILVSLLGAPIYISRGHKQPA